MDALVTIPHDPTYEVGYAKPPIETRFKKGQSGNPHGRPKKRQRALADMINDQMEHMFEFKDGGRIRYDRLVIRDLVRHAAQGERPALLLLFELIEWDEHSERVDRERESAHANLIKPALERWEAGAEADEKKHQEWLAKRRRERQGQEIPAKAASRPVDPPSDRSDMERAPMRTRIEFGTGDPSHDDEADRLIDEEAMVARRQPTWPDV